MPRQLFMLSLLLAIVFAATPFSAKTQTQADRSKYALLWEISGNGLQQPSYLFGSMHIRHKDIFEFPDSLFIYLERCEAFANEIHLDSAMNRFFEVAMSETDQYDKGKVTILPPDAPALEATDKRAAFSPPRRKTQQGMPTMLDAYLMNVARSQGKALYGLENIDEHLGIGEVSGEMSERSPREFGFAEREEGLEELIDIYQSGDLDRISTYVDSNGGGTDLELIPRNYIMVESIERITKHHSLFSVVGAAHLPGKEGVVELLQKRGYRVRKVVASFEGVAKQYEYTPLLRSWYRTEANDGSFAFETPLPAQAVGRKDLNSYYITFDLGDGMGYVVSAEYILPGAYHNFERQYFEDNGFKILSADTIQLAGVSGFEYRLAKPDEELKYYRARAYQVNGRLFYQQFGSFIEHNLYGPEAERFLNSLALQATQNTAQLVEKKEGAFRTTLPAGYAQSTYQDEEGQQHFTIQGIDEKGNFFAVRYYDLGPEFENPILADSVLLAQALAEVAQPFDKTFTKTDSSLIHGLPALSAQVNIAQGAKLHAQAFRRGLRVYSLTAAGDDNTRTFFSQFSLLPYTNSTLQNYSLTNGLLTANWPKAPQVQHEVSWKYQYDLHHPTDSIWTAKAQDTLSGFFHEVSVVHHSPYFRTRDYNTYYEALLPILYGDDYELLTSSWRKSASGSPIFTALVKPRHTFTTDRVQFELQGGILIWARVIGTEDWTQTAHVDSFFEHISLQQVPGSLKFDPLKSDASNFLRLVFDRSSVWDDNFEQQTAAYPFTEADLPLLERYLVTDDWNDSEPLNTILRRQLLKSLQAMQSPQALSLMEKIWQNSWVRSNYASDLLKAVAGIQLPQAGEVMARLLSQEPTMAPAWIDALKPHYTKHPEQFTAHYAGWRKLYEAQLGKAAFWELSVLALQDSAFNWAAEMPFYQAQASADLMQTTDKALTQAVFKFFMAQPERYAAFDQQAQSLFKRGKPSEITLAAAEYLLAAKLPIQQVSVDKVLADSLMFWPMVEVLNRYRRMDLLPASRFSDEYLAAKMLAAKLPNISSGKPVFVKTTIYGQGAERTKIYVFRLPLANGTNFGLGLVAGFDADNKDRNITNGGYVRYTTEPIQVWQIDDQITQLMESKE